MKTKGRNCWLKQYSYFILLQAVMWTSWKTSSFTTLLRTGTFRSYEPKLSSLRITFLVSYPTRPCSNWTYSVPRISYCFTVVWRFQRQALWRGYSFKREAVPLQNTSRESFFFPLLTLTQLLGKFSWSISIIEGCFCSIAQDPILQHLLPCLCAKSKLDLWQ